ncbi:MAG: 4Fe-4S dicluster domain-containing protein [Proteobacteria bacterium]|nr:4Fe-4S dicluster domain-containing protein [Pseudomonadota bacterium]
MKESKTDIQSDSSNTRLVTEEVFIGEDMPFEAPAKSMVAGSYYAAVEEVMPELTVDDDVLGESSGSSETSFALDRREFMKLFSMSALVGASACIPRPVEHIIPTTKQPVDHVPGIAKKYATTCGECSAGCGVEVKTKDGRPIKLEGWKKHPVNTGALCAVGQASIQGLYHPERPKHPMMKSSGRWLSTSWDDALERIGLALKTTSQVAIFTGALSPHNREFYLDFLKKMGASSADLYRWEPNNLQSAVAKAHQLAWQVDGVPRVQLSKARFVVGVSSDFLTTGVSPVYQGRGFSEGLSYQVSGNKGKFIQFESALTITGSKADKRFTIPVASELALVILLLESLANKVVQQGKITQQDPDFLLAQKIISSAKENLDSYKTMFTQEQLKALGQVSDELLMKPSCILSGGVEANYHTATQLQLATLLCNKLCGAYQEKILCFDEGWHPSSVGDGDILRFKEQASKYDVIFFINADPIRSLPESWGMSELLTSVETVVSIQNRPCPIDYYAKFQLPSHHYLESWGDNEALAGLLSIRQPTVRPLYATRQPEDMLLWVASFRGASLGYKDYRAYLQKKWQNKYQSFLKNVSFDVFIKSVLRWGWVGKLAKRRLANNLQDFSDVISLPSYQPPATGSLKLIAPYSYRLGDSRFSYLPILQEIGDSMSTIAWDSFAAINPHTCRKFGVKRNDVIRITLKQSSQGTSVSREVAVFPMPGVARDAIVIPQGGGVNDERNTIAHNLGINPLDVVGYGLDPLSKEPVTAGDEVTVTLTADKYRLAAMQKHNDIANRLDVFRKVGMTKLEGKIKKRKAAGQVKDLDDVPDLYPSLDKPETYMHQHKNEQKQSKITGQTREPSTIDYRWSMSVDLGKCTGCGACMVACSLENNVPQVGREQMNLGREMFWIRLDRYFDGDVDEPGVSFQPVMCQQCNHAPCEAVCPVFATTHDPEGINTMTYNRCVGTRYCANACPYKVRRFNWWTHKFGEMGRKPRDRTPRALNPDVTVRTRGVMEKCNFCASRLAAAKHHAKARAHDLGLPKTIAKNVQTACEQTCPTSAITFGNLKEPTSKVTRLRRDERAYLMLGGDPDHGHYGIKTLPNVFYLAEVVDDEFDTTSNHH